MDWIRCCGKANNNNFCVERDDGLPACQLWLLHHNVGFLLVWLEGKIHWAKQRAPVLLCSSPARILPAKGMLGAKPELASPTTSAPPAKNGKPHSPFP